MEFLKWLGGIVVIVWLLGFLLKIGGSFVHLLLIVAAIIFLFDLIFNRKK